MTNEELVRRYYDGDEAALEKLYHKNLGLICGIAKEAAADFNCLTVDEHHPSQFSAYTKTVLDDLRGEGALEFLTRIQSREYDENCAALSTYLYPHLKGRMTRWLEQNIGYMALSKDEMAGVRQAQRLYHAEWKNVDGIAEELDISAARANRYVRYNTHFLGVHDLVRKDYESDPYERLMLGMLTASAEQIVYRKVGIELLRELFDALPKKDRDILGKVYGAFGYSEATLKEIGMYHMMKESAVEKAKNRAIEKLRESYPGSRLQLWRAVHRMMRRPVPPPGEDSELWRNFPQYVRALAEVYGVMSEAASDMDQFAE